MRARAITLAVALLCGPALADEAPVTVTVRETALAATIDVEFQDAMAGGVSGTAILEQNGKPALKAGYGFADAGKTANLTVDAEIPSGVVDRMPNASAADVYRWFQSAAFRRDGSVPLTAPWEIRKADDGHVVQISRNVTSGDTLSYFCWRPDDRVFVYLFARGSAAADKALLNRVMTSVRDAGKMPVSGIH
jgi:hypothetical protein